MRPYETYEHAKRLAEALRALLGPSANLTGTKAVIVREAVAALQAFDESERPHKPTPGFPGS